MGEWELSSPEAESLSLPCALSLVMHHLMTSRLRDNIVLSRFRNVSHSGEANGGEH